MQLSWLVNFKSAKPMKPMTSDQTSSFNGFPAPTQTHVRFTTCRGVHLEHTMAVKLDQAVVNQFFNEVNLDACMLAR